MRILRVKENQIRRHGDRCIRVFFGKRKTSLLLLLLLIVTSLFLIQHDTIIGQDELYNETVIDIDLLGTGIVETTTQVSLASLIPCIGQCLYILDITPESINGFIDNNTIILQADTNSTITVFISYVSQIGFYQDDHWIINYNSVENTKIILPPSALPVDISPIPSDFAYTSDGRLLLYMPPGNITITYILSSLPEISNYTTITSSEESNQTETVINTEKENVSTGTANETSTITSRSMYEKLFIIILLFAGFIILLIHRQSRKKLREKREEILEYIEYLDDRDRAIVMKLLEKGPLPPGELLKELDIPRAAFYRRINRLKQSGIIEQFEVGGKVFYRVKRGVKNNSE